MCWRGIRGWDLRLLLARIRTRTVPHVSRATSQRCLRGARRSTCWRPTRAAMRCLCPSGCTPAARRRFAASASTTRGRAILQTGYPVGGNAVFVNTTELRLPAPTLPFVGDSVSFCCVSRHGQRIHAHLGYVSRASRIFISPNQSDVRERCPQNVVRDVQLQLLLARGGAGRAIQDAGRADSSGFQLEPESAGVSGDLRLQWSRAVPRPGESLQLLLQHWTGFLSMSERGNIRARMRDWRRWRWRCCRRSFMARQAAHGAGAAVPPVPNAPPVASTGRAGDAGPRGCDRQRRPDSGERCGCGGALCGVSAVQRAEAGDAGGVDRAADRPRLDPAADGAAAGAADPRCAGRCRTGDAAQEHSKMLRPTTARRTRGGRSLLRTRALPWTR